VGPPRDYISGIEPNRIRLRIEGVVGVQRGMRMERVLVGRLAIAL
jgi:hypothetical protein